MEWLLIIWLYNGDTSFMVTAPMETEAVCEAALLKYKQRSNYISRGRGICVKVVE